MVCFEFGRRTADRLVEISAVPTSRATGQTAEAFILRVTFSLSVMGRLYYYVFSPRVIGWVETDFQTGSISDRMSAKER
jgi:hypothetical protein